MPKTATVEIINFGDELLIGIRENSHLKYLGEQLSRYGLTVLRSRVITDEVDEIQNAFSHAWAHSDLVITTGGLGPTADDLTRETIAQALGAELVFDSEIEQTLKDRFSALGYKMAEHHLRQCYRFKKGLVLPNDLGTAPGLVFESEGKVLIMLPGPTQELVGMFGRYAIPFLQKKGLLAGQETYLQIRTCGLGESAVEQKMQPIIEQNSALTVAYCVHNGLVDVRLSSRSGQLSMEALKRIGQEVRVLFGMDFVAFGHCSLAKVVFHELRALDRTLAVAESCTGGLLGDAFTNIRGASKVFRGGVICYTNDVKVTLLGIPESLIDQHGAVSQECAIAMASCAAEKMSADHALSVTGFAGPDGGDSKNPVGTIHIGYHSPVGVWCKTVRYTGGRLDVKARAVTAALDWMRRKLKKYKLEEFLSCGEND